MVGTMAAESTSSKNTLPEGFFDMEIVSNRPDNVELNEGSSSSS